MVDDRTHGQQFKARFLKTSAPTSIDGIEKYLGSGMICGIGPVYAKKLVRAFGEEVFDTIEAEPERLREVLAAAELVRHLSRDVRKADEIQEFCSPGTDIAVINLPDLFRDFGEASLRVGVNQDQPSHARGLGNSPVPSAVT